ncbi:MAG: hypothetical protein M1415_02015 [Firmicutes bacterium]|nr:hypothetical protein [Bacillota bacterium]
MKTCVRIGRAVLLGSVIPLVAVCTLLGGSVDATLRPSSTVKMNPTKGQPKTVMEHVLGMRVAVPSAWHKRVTRYSNGKGVALFSGPLGGSLELAVTLPLGGAQSWAPLVGYTADNLTGFHPYEAVFRQQTSHHITYVAQVIVSGGSDVSLSLQVPRQDAALAARIYESWRHSPRLTPSMAVHRMEHMKTSNSASMLPNGEAWYLAGGSHNGVLQAWYLFHTEDAGKRWRLLNYTNKPQRCTDRTCFFPNRATPASIRFLSTRVGVIAQPAAYGHSVFIYRSTDGGQSWTAQRLALNAMARTTAAPRIAVTSGTVTFSVLMLGKPAEVFISRNHAISWRLNRPT